MLRTDEQTALGELAVAHRQASAAYADGVKLIPDSGPIALLEDLKSGCDALIEALDSRLRSLGDLPPTPDQDVEAVRALWRRAKVRLTTESDVETILNDLVGFEAAILGTLDAIKDDAMGHPSRPLADEARSRATETIATLEALGATRP